MTIFILFCSLIFALYISPVYAACDPNIPADCPAGLDQIEAIVGNVISVVVGMGFIAMLVLLIWAGFKYITSGGEPKAIQAAHAIVSQALLGILFMIIAWLILQLIAAFTGINVTVFDIKALCGNLELPFCDPSP